MRGPGPGSLLDTPLTRDAGIELPVIGGPMYPCSNPELVAAVSAAGGIGIIQPVSLTFVHGWDFREGIRYIRSLTDRPVGLNVLIEGSNKAYRRRMEAWIEVALEEGIRFFLTSLGKPRWVVDRVHGAGGVVYHDVTERRWALKAVESGVDGLIAVNAEAGGHAGPRSPRPLLEELADLGLPLVCAGGIATADDFVEALRMGYAGVQVGTRLIATPECTASDAYKEAILGAVADDIVLSERITGVPVALINTPYVQAMGTRAGPLARRLLKGRRTKHWMRSFYALRSLWQLRRASLEGGRRQFWQAGRSVEGIERIEPVAEILARFRNRTASFEGR
ncbi:MAG TPA: nitronate monooxygenase [Longimicrobiales bacterium]|nr:nitronate monooxygenase [Longimicrobiales bacterium]